MATSETPAKKAAAAPQSAQKNDTVTEGPAPVPAGRSQAGEAVTAPLTNRPPRGLDELPSDFVPDEEAAAGLINEVRRVVDKETEQGYRGFNTDPTPNYNYTLKGVGEGLPTPETVVITPKAAQASE